MEGQEVCIEVKVNLMCWSLYTAGFSDGSLRTEFTDGKEVDCMMLWTHHINNNAQ
jgi:hypothetical protein